MKDRQIDVRRHLAIACYVLVGCYLLLALYLVSGLTGPGRYYRSGVPAGADFVQIWAASSLASQGKAPLVYNNDELSRAEHAVIGGEASFNLPWHYPPSFLWLIKPLSLLNYFLALALWLFIPLGILLLVLYKIFPDRLTVWLALAFIATAENLFYGQGLFLVALLLGGGLLLVDRHPFPAGLLFAVLINYKPHLGVLIPVALLAGRRWQALGALAATGVVLAAVSAWALGLDTWLAFWQDLHLMKSEMSVASLWDRMPSVLGAVRLPGGSGWLALTLQICAALGGVAALWWVWRGAVSLPVRGAVLVVATLLAHPHVFNYDLTLLLLPMALTAREGLDQQWGRLNHLILGLAWLTPMLDLISVALGRIHLAPILLAAWLIFLLTRAAWRIRTEEPLPSG